MKCKNIRVLTEDVKKMRDVCLMLYLKDHPDRKGEKISDAEMFTSLVTFYTHN